MKSTERTKVDVEEWQLKLVQPIPGEKMTFRVFSETDPSIAYKVVLTALRVKGRCNGKCECDDFVKRKRIVLRDTGKVSSRSRCKHIKWAAAFHYEETTPMFADHYGHKNEHENEE